MSEIVGESKERTLAQHFFFFFVIKGWGQGRAPLKVGSSLCSLNLLEGQRWSTGLSQQLSQMWGRKGVRGVEGGLRLHSC